MILTGEAQRLRAYVGESDQYHGRPLYEAIVALAREQGLAGATVTRGVLGFGANSRIHTAKILRLSEDLPMIVEIVDTAEKVQKLLPQLDAMITEGLITVDSVNVHVYRHSHPPRAQG